MSKKFDGLEVDLKTIILLNAEGKQNLISFTEAGIKDIGFAAYIEEVQSHVYLHRLNVPYRNVGILKVSVSRNETKRSGMLMFHSEMLVNYYEKTSYNQSEHQLHFQNSASSNSTRNNIEELKFSIKSNKSELVMWYLLILASHIFS